MKRKLIALALTALLVLTLAPMAVTAAGPTPKTTLKDNVQFWNYVGQRA